MGQEPARLYLTQVRVVHFPRGFHVRGVPSAFAATVCCSGFCWLVLAVLAVLARSSDVETRWQVVFQDMTWSLTAACAEEGGVAA